MLGPRPVAAVLLGSSLCLSLPAAASSEPYTLTASTVGSPVPLVAGEWSGDGREAHLDLDFAAVSPASRTRFVASWTSSTGRAPKGFSTAAAALAVERGPVVSPARATALPVLTDLHLEARQRIGSGRWSRWSGDEVRSYKDLEQSEYVGVGSTDCLDVERPTTYRVQYRLTGSKGGTDAGGVTLAVRLGGSDCQVTPRQVLAVGKGLGAVLGGARPRPGAEASTTWP